jgi:multidrug transporter EmrE-like cation transporter
VPVGIALALVATLCFAAGNALEKRGVDRLPPFSARNLRRAVGGLASSGWWLAGAAISVLGLLAQILAYSHVAISIVQSVGVAGIVLLVAISRASFGEHLRRRELTGLATAVVSLVLVSLSLTRSADAAGIHGAPGAILISTVCTILFVSLALASRALRGDVSGFVHGCAAGLLYGLSGLGAKGLSTLIARDGWRGTFEHMFTMPFPYVFLGCWTLGLVVFQLGIQRCRVGVVGPLSSMVGSVFMVAVGTPVFGERLPSDPALLVLRLAGFAGILLGSALVGWGGHAATLEPPAAMSVRFGK